MKKSTTMGLGTSLPPKVVKPAAKKAASAPKAMIANRVTLPGSKQGSERSVEVRKIENGFVVRESTWDGKGRYSSKETFSAKAPVLQVTPAKGK